MFLILRARRAPTWCSCLQRGCSALGRPRYTALRYMSVKVLRIRARSLTSRWPSTAASSRSSVPGELLQHRHGDAAAGLVGEPGVRAKRASRCGECAPWLALRCQRSRRNDSRASTMGVCWLRANSVPTPRHDRLEHAPSRSVSTETTRPAALCRVFPYADMGESRMSICFITGLSHAMRPAPRLAATHRAFASRPKTKGGCRHEALASADPATEPRISALQDGVRLRMRCVLRRRKRHLIRHLDRPHSGSRE